jgi:tetratricopeptide (TPR) repeat protein
MDGDARRAANWGVGGALVGRLGKWEDGMPYEERVRLFGMLPHAKSMVGHFGGGGVGLGGKVVKRVACVAFLTGKVLDDGLSDFENARGYYEESLAMMRKVYGGEAANPDIATSLHALGSVCYGKGEYEKARGYYEESLAMERKVHGGEAANPGIAGSLNSLGNVCYREDDLVDAVRYLKQAWAMQVKTTSEAHPDAQTMLDNLQGVQSEMKTQAGQAKMKQYAAARRKQHATAAASPTTISTQGSTVTTLRPCGFPGCSRVATKRCSACKGQWYCSQEHQRSDWKAHKIMCRKEAEVGGH